MDRLLSQEEIDKVFSTMREGDAKQDELARRARPYDFRRPDRIAKDQLRALHVLHENFVRAVASSLSAYLRAYVVVNLVSVEQISFREFTQGLPSPTCVAVLTMKPYEGNAALEVNPSVVFPILEILLGGAGRRPTKIEREVTEIEQSLMDGVLRLILQNLKTAWQMVTKLDFAVSNHETEPGLLQILAPNEALVAIGMEIRIGDNSGMMNLGIPSILVKMLRQKFDQQWSVRKADSTGTEHERMLRLIRPSVINVDAQLRSNTITVQEMMNLNQGDVLQFDYNVGRPLDLLINNKLKYRGEVVTNSNHRAFHIHDLIVT